MQTSEHSLRGNLSLSWAKLFCVSERAARTAVPLRPRHITPLPVPPHQTSPPDCDGTRAAQSHAAHQRRLTHAPSAPGKGSNCGWAAVPLGAHTRSWRSVVYNRRRTAPPPIRTAPDGRVCLARSSPQARHWRGGDKWRALCRRS
eukprot:4246790-Prymnesium_polylepis.2